MGWRLVQKGFSALINILYVGVIEESSTSSTSGPGLFEPAEVGHQASASLAKPSVCCAAMLWHTAATCLQLMLTGNRIGCSSAPRHGAGKSSGDMSFRHCPRTDTVNRGPPGKCAKLVHAAHRRCRAPGCVRRIRIESAVRSNPLSTRSQIASAILFC